jgi:hypothetical protein
VSNRKSYVANDPEALQPNLAQWPQSQLRTASPIAYYSRMDKQPKSRVADWAPKIVVLSLCVVVLYPQAIRAQEPVPRNRTILIPRSIRGQAVESVVINRVVLVFGELTVAEGLAAHIALADQPPQQKLRVKLFSGTFDELVYGSNAVDALLRLENRLKEQIEKIDRISGLTDSQRQKLQLAGRGDIKRLFDRAEKLRATCDYYTDVADLNQFWKWTDDLKREAKTLQGPFNAGPFDAESLFAKCMRTILMPEQAAKYASFEATHPYQPPKRHPARLEGTIQLR